MASTSSSRNMVPFAVDDKKPVIIENSGFVSEPAMTSVENSVWGEELIIPHKLEDNDEALLQALEAGFDALQQKTPKGKGASKAKETTTSTDSPAPAATSKKSLPNTGAKLRKRLQMGTKETGEPTIQKKQKTLTIQESSPADNVSTNPTTTAPSGEGQRDTEKASVETSEASMPPNPKRKTDKEKKKKKKVKPSSKPSAGSEKDTEVPHSNPPVEKQPTNNENPSTEDPAPRQDKISLCSQDPGAQVKFSCP
ncbi:hypothetical protein P8452_18300 [Trifolium repens]|nr:hypothetical protein P8452_18300 [Trifolium repens]